MMMPVPVRRNGPWLKAKTNATPMSVPGMAAGSSVARSRLVRPGTPPRLTRNATTPASTVQSTDANAAKRRLLPSPPTWLST